MSRQLPAQPNLEHLRNQAKDLLEDLRRKNPEAKLADALHAVAREYGFSTWPVLKAHVESLPRESASPLAGRWTADVAKSKQHPANPFRSATIQFAVAGDTVTIADVFVDESGREVRGTNTILADGSPHGSDGYVLVARWLGSHVLEAVATKDDRVVGRVRYEVSPEGTMLTIASGSTSGFSADWADQVIVLQRLVS